MHRVLVVVTLFVCAVAALGQESPVAPPTGGTPASAGHREHKPGVMGTITAMDDHSLTVKTMGGQTATVNLNDKTQFRKDRQPAKQADFKVGDIVFVGGQSTGENVWQADFVATRSGGPGGSPRDGQHMMGGEIKSIDGMQITLMRPDGSTQTISVDENTSFRKGEESITLADLHVGDHIFGRGEVKNGVFVPSMLTVGDPRTMWHTPPNANPGDGQR